VVRLEQAREVGGQEDDAPPGGGIDDDVGPRPATLQEPGRDLLGIRIPIMPWPATAPVTSPMPQPTR